MRVVKNDRNRREWTRNEANGREKIVVGKHLTGFREHEPNAGGVHECHRQSAVAGLAGSRALNRRQSRDAAGRAPMEICARRSISAGIFPVFCRTPRGTPRCRNNRSARCIPFAASPRALVRTRRPSHCCNGTLRTWLHSPSGATQKRRHTP